MKKFKFRFEAVEKVRKVETEKQMKELSLAVKEQERLESQLKEIEQKLHDEMARVRALVDRNEEDEMNLMSLRYRKYLRGQMKLKHEEILKAHQQVVLERRKLIEKSKDQKAIEKLKEKERERYYEEVRKSENKEMDETASTLWLHNRT